MPKESPTRFTQEQRCKIITFDGTEIDKKRDLHTSYYYIRGDSTEIYEKTRFTHELLLHTR